MTRRLTAKSLEEIGTVCFGPNWQSAVAARLQITSRRIRYIMAGAQPVTAEMESALFLMLQWRISELQSTVNRLF